MKSFCVLTTDSPVNAFDETCGKQKYGGKRKSRTGGYDATCRLGRCAYSAIQ